MSARRTTSVLLSFALSVLLTLSAGAAAEHPVPASPLWLTHTGENGPGLGKHIVLIAAEQEYRSEYSMPMLARLLSQHHGFHCTVLFSLNQDNDVDPTQKIRWEDKTVTHNIPGLEHLEKCDLVIMFSRRLSLPPEQLQHIYDYLDPESRSSASARPTMASSSSTTARPARRSTSEKESSVVHSGIITDTGTRTPHAAS